MKWKVVSVDAPVQPSKVKNKQCSESWKKKLRKYQILFSPENPKIV